MDSAYIGGQNHAGGESFAQTPACWLGANWIRRFNTGKYVGDWELTLSLRCLSYRNGKEFVCRFCKPLVMSIQ